MPKKLFTVKKNECVACGECAKACPKKAIKIIKGVYAEINKDICVGCGICDKACPANAIKGENF